MFIGAMCQLQKAKMNMGGYSQVALSNPEIVHKIQYCLHNKPGGFITLRDDSFYTVCCNLKTFVFYSNALTVIKSLTVFHGKKLHTMWVVDIVCFISTWYQKCADCKLSGSKSNFMNICLICVLWYHSCEISHFYKMGDQC